VLAADGLVPLSCSEICYVLYLVTGVGRPYSVVGIDSSRLDSGGQLDGEDRLAPSLSASILAMATDLSINQQSWEAG
jgi:hypothetical protein